MVNNAVLDFGGYTDLAKKISRFCGLIPLKKPKREASVSHFHACCLDVCRRQRVFIFLGFVVLREGPVWAQSESAYFKFNIPSKAVKFSDF